MSSFDLTSQGIFFWRGSEGGDPWSQFVVIRNSSPMAIGVHPNVKDQYGFNVYCVESYHLDWDIGFPMDHVKEFSGSGNAIISVPNFKCKLVALEPKDIGGWTFIFDYTMYSDKELFAKGTLDCSRGGRSVYSYIHVANVVTLPDWPTLP